MKSSRDSSYPSDSGTRLINYRLSFLEPTRSPRAVVTIKWITILLPLIASRARAGTNYRFRALKSRVLSTSKLYDSRISRDPEPRRRVPLRNPNHEKEILDAGQCRRLWHSVNKRRYKRLITTQGTGLVRRTVKPVRWSKLDVVITLYEVANERFPGAHRERIEQTTLVCRARKR